MITLLVLAALAIAELAPRILRLNGRWETPPMEMRRRMRALRLGGLSLLFLIGCGSAPLPTTDFSNPSPLDGKQDSANSWHKAHVIALDPPYDYQLDDGTVVSMYFTGGTSPSGSSMRGLSGMLYVSVPSFDEHDGDHSYYFQKFVPDIQQPCKQISDTVAECGDIHIMRWLGSNP